MLSKKILAALSLCLVALIPLPGRAVAQEPAAATGMPTASLPLEEVLRLYRENEKTRQQKHPVPPFAATVVKAELEGRLLDGAIDLAVVFEVVVLDGQDWVSVPLLERDAAMTVVSLPDLGKAVLAAQGDHVSLVTRTEGTYRFRLELLVKARTEGRLQTARLRLATACMARLTLKLDANLFELVDTKTVTQGDTAVIYPDDAAFGVAWRRVAESPRARLETTTRPPVESVITSAHGDLVSTLEGKAILRMLYELRFEGIRPITFALPEGQVPVHAYLNGRARDLAADEGTLQLNVEPRRAGDQSATLELVLEIDQGGYNLAGDLLFALPEVSWPINELFVDVHLPSVFGYTWTGGSLAPVESSPQVAYSYAIPTPGEHLSFHQFLISRTAADLRVDYDIDLDGKYFGAEPGISDR